MQVVIGIELGDERVDARGSPRDSKRACGPISHSAVLGCEERTRGRQRSPRAARPGRRIAEFEAMLTLSAKPDEAEKK